MGRPTDWHVLDLDQDPVPGDPVQVEALAKKLHDFADDVGTALRAVKGLSSDSAVQTWTGKSGDEYRRQFDDLPGELEKLERSYRMCGDALGVYWPKLQHAQRDADRALEQGRQARADLSAAHSDLHTADDWVKRANTAAKKYQEDPEPNVPPPSDAQVKAASRNARDAGASQRSAQKAVDGAQGRLDAAKKLAADAAKLRDDAANTAHDEVGRASDAGIQNKHWWEKVVDFVVDHWDDIVAVCKVIVAVLGVIVMIIGGPLAWIVLAAALVVLADTVLKYLQGKASLWDVMFAALDCIPGFKGLTTAGGLLKLAKNAPGLLRSGKALENLANGVRRVGPMAMRMGKDGLGTLTRAWDGTALNVASAMRGGGLRPLTDGVRDALRGLNPLQSTRKYTSAEGHYYASRVLRGGRADGQPVLAGHGFLEHGAGDFTVPDGTTISFYAEHGEALHGLDGVAVEGGVYPDSAVQVYHPGDIVPNYTLAPPAATGGGGFTVFENSTTVSERTSLSDLVGGNMGDVHWAACREIV